MAKSIWKPGVKITRKEKKVLRRLMPHPNKGRRHYQWRVENTRISRIMKDVINDDGTLNIVNVAKRTTRVSDKLTMKKEFYFEEFKPSAEKHYFPTTNEEIKGVHLRGQASDVSSVPKE